MEKKNKAITQRHKDIVYFLKDLGNCCKRETIEDIWYNTKWGENTAAAHLKFLCETENKTYRIKRERVNEYKTQYYYWGSGPMPKNYIHADLVAKVWVYFKYTVKRDIVTWVKEPSEFEAIRPDIKIVYKNKNKKGTSTVYVEVERSHVENIAKKLELYQQEYNRLKNENGAGDYVPFSLLYFYKNDYEIKGFTPSNGFKINHVPIEKLEERPPKPESLDNVVGSKRKKRK